MRLGVAMAVIALVVAPFALAAVSTSASASASPVRERGAGNPAPAVTIAAAISTVTGIAISPLLGTGAYGAYQWFAAEDEAARAALPWYAQMEFWLPALVIVGVCAAKDAFGAVVPPGLKKPLDVLETIENKISALIAAGAVIPLSLLAFSEMVVDSRVSEATTSWPSGLAMLPLGAIDLSVLLSVFVVPIGIAVFAVVWMASHAVNVLILLSPWGAIDTALKSARTGLLALLAAGAIIDPRIAAVLSIAIVVVSYFVAGWAFRLTVFGSVFCWDVATFRRVRFRPEENGNRVFAGGHLRDVPVRTYGRFVRTADGGREFVYRLWPWTTRQSLAIDAAPETLAIGRGLFFSSVTRSDSETLLLLPPRYRGHEEAIAEAYGLRGGVRPAGLRRTWAVMRDLFAGSAARAQVI
jgi:hypothetical protein